MIFFKRKLDMKMTIAALVLLALTGCASLKEPCSEQSARLQAKNASLIERKKVVESYLEDYRKIPSWQTSLVTPRELQYVYVDGYNRSFDEFVKEVAEHNARCVRN
jgi:hypothetical protein